MVSSFILLNFMTAKFANSFLQYFPNICNNLEIQQFKTNVKGVALGSVVYVCARACLCVPLCACTCVYVYVCVCVCIHMSAVACGSQLHPILLELELEMSVSHLNPVLGTQLGSSGRAANALAH